MNVEGAVELAALFAKESAEVDARAEAVVKKAALNVKNAMRSDAEASRHFEMAWTINYDMVPDSDGPAAEVGPEKKGAGHLANIAYFGGAHGGGGTVRDPQEAADEEAQAFEDFLAKAVFRL